jgi:hypothetical protein
LFAVRSPHPHIPFTPASRGALDELLANPIYVGEIRHKREHHHGQHQPILERETWERVQQRLRSGARRDWLRSLIWVDATEKNDAFLSYSWKSDNKVAPVIQSVIQHFLCPWYKTRALTVFRDLSCLPAGSSLEAELFDRLDKSAHLIVLASPEAKSSRGMEIEATHWFSQPRKGEVLIIVTAGEFNAWEQIRDRLLPPVVAHDLRTEPLWIPLQQRRARILASPSDHQLRGELVEDLKQILLRFYPTCNWDQLRGQERLQRRRAWHLVWGVIVLLLLLLASASGFAWYALEQRDADRRAPGTELLAKQPVGKGSRE